MRGTDFAILLALIGAMAIWTVREQARSVALGYEEGRLITQRDQLRRASGELRFQRARLSSPDRLERVAAQYGLGLVERGKLDPKTTTRGAVFDASPRRDGRPALARRGRDGR